MGARAGKQGEAICIMAPAEMTKWKMTFSQMKEIPQGSEIDSEDLVHARKVLKAAQEVEKNTHKAKKATKEQSWFHKAAEDLDMELDEDLQDLTSHVKNDKLQI